MGAYWDVIKLSIFLFDRRICEILDFGRFSKKFDQKWLLEVAESAKKISKNSKKWWKKFFFIFRFIMFYWMYRDHQTWYNDYKTIFPPLYNQNVRQITFWKWCKKSMKIIKKSTKCWKLFFMENSSKFFFQNEICRVFWLFRGGKSDFIVIVSSLGNTIHSIEHNRNENREQNFSSFFRIFWKIFWLIWEFKMPFSPKNSFKKCPKSPFSQIRWSNKKIEGFITSQ